MCWKSLQDRAAELGVEIEYRMRGMAPDLTEHVGSGWTLVGNYDHVAAIWVMPLTDAARRLSSRHLVKMLVECDPFVETVGDYDDDFFACGAPFRAATSHPEWGCMPT